MLSLTNSSHASISLAFIRTEIPSTSQEVNLFGERMGGRVRDFRSVIFCAMTRPPAADYTHADTSNFVYSDGKLQIVYITVTRMIMKKMQLHDHWLISCHLFVVTHDNSHFSCTIFSPLKGSEIWGSNNCITVINIANNDWCLWKHGMVCHNTWNSVLIDLMWRHVSNPVVAVQSWVARTFWWSELRKYKHVHWLLETIFVYVYVLLLVKQ